MSEETFPDRLRIRDTQLHDDMGGAGQRIYTTAGQGYTKVEYVRADLHDALRAEVESLSAKVKGFRFLADQHKQDADKLRSQLSTRDAEARALRSFARAMYKAIRTRSPIWHDIADALVEHGLLYKPGPFVGIGKPTPLLDPQGSPGEQGPGGEG